MATKLSIAGNTFLYNGKLTKFTHQEAATKMEAEGDEVLSGLTDY